MTFNQDDATVRITEAIIGAAMEVHRVLGPGLLESAYQACLEYELFQRDIKFARQVPVPVLYRAVKVECGYRLDFLVENAVVVEIKSVECLARVHTAQMITYLKLTGCRVGLIINFNMSLLKDGVRHVDHPDIYRERVAKRSKQQERRENGDENQQTI
jgi:GxxExxY protein